MPKIKIPRKNISLDMTAMCDMAFLLLTFFMLATKFKPQEAVAIDIPSSVSPVKLPDSDMMVIAVKDDGAVFFGIDGQQHRLKLLESMSQKYKISFTEAEKREFSLTESVGVPMSQLKSLLNVEASQRSKVQQIGIPADSLQNELRDWITYSIYANEKIKIAIKGDRKSNYEVIDRVVGTLLDLEITKFNLVTSLEKNAR